MKSENTQQRLAYIMNKKNIRQVDILKKCEPLSEKYGVKIGKSDLSQYVNGKTEPSQDKLIILGMALDVSEAWLMGFDVPMERKSATDVSSIEIIKNKSLDELTEDEKNLLTAYQKLNSVGKQEAIKRISELTSLSQYTDKDTNENTEKVIG